MTPKRRIHHLSLLLLLTFFGLGNHVFFSLTTPPKQQSNRRIVVVVFYHLPRTGGTTIREHFQTTVPYLRVAKHRDWDRIEQRIARNPDTSSLFIELHGTVPGLAVLHERIQRWRDQGVPLFAFTVVREPVAWSRSYFHHFHAPNCTWNWCERDTYPPDEDENEHLWKTMVPNHQCQLLLLGQRENKQRRRRRRPDDGRIHVTDEQCRHELVPLLEQDWDWIGTTETLETITLPLLTQILSLEPQSSSIRKTTTTTKKNASPFQRRDNTQQLESATIQQIRQASSFDEALYERVRHERWQRKTTR